MFIARSEDLRYKVSSRARACARPSNPPLTAKRDIILKRLLLKGRSFFIDIATNEFIRMVAISIKETLFTARLRIISSFCKGPAASGGDGRHGANISSRSSQFPALAKSFLR